MSQFKFTESEEALLRKMWHERTSRVIANVRSWSKLANENPSWTFAYRSELEERSKLAELEKFGRKFLGTGSYYRTLVHSNSGRWRRKA